MFNFAYQLELLLTAAKPPLYLSEMTVSKQGPRYICLEGKPGGWLFRFLLSLIGLAPAPRKIEVFDDRIEYSVNAKWFQSKEKITFSTICSTGHQFFRFPHFLILAWICIIYGVHSLLPLFKSDDSSDHSYSAYAPSSPITAQIAAYSDSAHAPSGPIKEQKTSYSYRDWDDDDYHSSKAQNAAEAVSSPSTHGAHDDADSKGHGFVIISILLFIAAAIFFWLYHKVQRYIIYAYSNCGKGMLFAFQPRRSFIFAPKDAINTSLGEVEKMMDFLGSLIEANKAAKVAPAFSSVPYSAQNVVSPVQTASAQNSEGVPSPAAAPVGPTMEQSVQAGTSEVNEQEYEKYLGKCLNQFGCSHIYELAKCKSPLSESLYFKKALKYAPPNRKKQLLEVQRTQEDKRSQSRIYIVIAFFVLVLVIVGLVLHAKR